MFFGDFNGGSVISLTQHFAFFQGNRVVCFLDFKVECCFARIVVHALGNHDFDFVFADLTGGNRRPGFFAVFLEHERYFAHSHHVELIFGDFNGGSVKNLTQHCAFFQGNHVVAFFDFEIEFGNARLIRFGFGNHDFHFVHADRHGGNRSPFAFTCLIHESDRAVAHEIELLFREHHGFSVVLLVKHNAFFQRYGVGLKSGDLFCMFLFADGAVTGSRSLFGCGGFFRYFPFAIGMFRLIFHFLAVLIGAGVPVILVVVGIGF